jgi:hypothetical protein
MVNSGVPDILILFYADTLDVSKVLPFRYIAAAKVCPQFEGMLERMMLRSLEKHDKLYGKTLLLVDVSGSMFGGVTVSKKSDLGRFDAAAALAMLCREVCESVDIYSFSNSAVRIPPRRGFALRDTLETSQGHGSTYLGKALTEVNNGSYDRIIVFTDEQAQDKVPDPGTKGYIINVAAYANGINHKSWTTVTGFSEAIIDYILALESEGTFAS